MSLQIRSSKWILTDDDCTQKPDAVTRAEVERLINFFETGPAYQSAGLLCASCGSIDEAVPSTDRTAGSHYQKNGNGK